MTGHLVLTTLHTQTPPSAIARLNDMGIEPALLATSDQLHRRAAARAAALHQCSEAVRGDAGGARRLGLDPDQATPLLPAARLRRVLAARGYRGRVAMYEVMPCRARFARVLERSTEEISAAALEQGMRTLRQDGARLCVAGVSSLDEIRRVVGYRSPAVRREIADPRASSRARTGRSELASL